MILPANNPGGAEVAARSVRIEPGRKRSGSPRGKPERQPGGRGDGADSSDRKAAALVLAEPSKGTKLEVWAPLAGSGR